MKRLTHALQILSSFSLLATSCGGSGQSTQAPAAIQPNPVSVNSNGDYLNILNKSVEFMDSTGDPDGTGELQLITIVSDDSGHSDALICPYGAVVKIQTGDRVNPCNAGLSYPLELVEGHLYIMIIAVDIDDTGVLGDISTNVLTSGLAYGLGQAIEAAGYATGSAPVIIGTLVLETVLGYAGGKVQEYFEKSDVLGSQSFVLSQASNWNSDHPIVAQSVNGSVEFSFVVQQSSIASGQLVDSEAQSPDVPVVQVENPTQTHSSGSPRIYGFSACIDPCNGSNAITNFPEGTSTIHISWKYENIPTGSHYIRYWTHENKGLWMTYDCSWDRSSSGEINMKFYETGGGLASGAWTLIMKVDDAVVLQEQLTIAGNENYWAPLSPLYKCF